MCIYIYIYIYSIISVKSEPAGVAGRRGQTCCGRFVLGGINYLSYCSGDVLKQIGGETWNGRFDWPRSASRMRLDAAEPYTKHLVLYIYIYIYICVHTYIYILVYYDILLYIIYI